MYPGVVAQPWSLRPSSDAKKASTWHIGNCASTSYIVVQWNFYTGGGGGGGGGGIAASVCTASSDQGIGVTTP